MSLNSVPSLFCPTSIYFFNTFIIYIALLQSLSWSQIETHSALLIGRPGSRDSLVLRRCKAESESAYCHLQYRTCIMLHPIDRERFRDLNLKTNLIHAIFMRSDFMLGRFVCTADDNTVVIMQVHAISLRMQACVSRRVACFHPYDIKEAYNVQLL